MHCDMNVRLTQSIALDWHSTYKSTIPRSHRREETLDEQHFIMERAVSVAPREPAPRARNRRPALSHEERA
jgi:hypothetical protein